MAEQTEMVTGGCMCGAVRYRASGAPQGSGYCHCKSCRHHSGAPVAAFVVFAAEQVEWVSGDRARYESSPGIFRAFCRDGGTSLTWEGPHKGCDQIDLHISTLDEPSAFLPKEHTHYGERIPWLQLTDDLPKYPGSMP